MLNFLDSNNQFHVHRVIFCSAIINTSGLMACNFTKYKYTKHIDTWNNHIITPWIRWAWATLLESSRYNKCITCHHVKWPFLLFFCPTVIEEANWLTLSQDLQKPGEGFDAVICLGNSFAHLPDFKGECHRAELKRNKNFFTPVDL